MAGVTKRGSVLDRKRMPQGRPLSVGHPPEFIEKRSLDSKTIERSLLNVCLALNPFGFHLPCGPLNSRSHFTSSPQGGSTASRMQWWPGSGLTRKASAARPPRSHARLISPVLNEAYGDTLEPFCRIQRSDIREEKEGVELTNRGVDKADYPEQLRPHPPPHSLPTLHVLGPHLSMHHCLPLK